MLDEESNLVFGNFAFDKKILNLSSKNNIGVNFRVQKQEERLFLLSAIKKADGFLKPSAFHRRMQVKLLQ